MKDYLTKKMLQSTSPSLQARGVRIGKRGYNASYNELTCQPVNPRFTDADQCIGCIQRYICANESQTNLKTQIFYVA